jgi:hypothetical protein
LSREQIMEKHWIQASRPPKHRDDKGARRRTRRVRISAWDAERMLTNLLTNRSKLHALDDTRAH